VQRKPDGGKLPIDKKTHTLQYILSLHSEGNQVSLTMNKVESTEAGSLPSVLYFRFSSFSGSCSYQG
jgi:hypothetical protein